MNQYLLEQNIEYEMKKISKNQKVLRNDNDELIVKTYPKNKQPIIQQQKINLPSGRSCRRNKWLKFDKG